MDKLAARTRVLGPAGGAGAYRGRDLRGLFGTDAHAERLTALVEHTVPPPAAEVMALAAGCAADPTAATLPRTVLALLATTAPAPAAGLGHVRRAAELAPEWVRTGLGDESGRVLTRFLVHLFRTAADAARRANDPAPVRDLLEYLDHTADPGSPARAALGRTAGPFFAAVHALGLGADAAPLLRRLRSPVPAGPLEVGAAVGWFATGDEDAGLRLLDAARGRLFETGVADTPERTALAVGYAAALRFAPARVGPGRLLELFQRLGRIDTRGATNRYYTLQPLELIDAAVGAVATDDFAVGPGVRAWLDGDADRTRRRVARDVAALCKVEEWRSGRVEE